MFSKFRSKDKPSKKEKSATSSSKKESSKKATKEEKPTAKPISPSKTVIPTASPSPTKREASAPEASDKLASTQPKARGPVLEVEGSQVQWKGGLGKGGSSTVLRGEWNGCDTAVKVYQAQFSDSLGLNEQSILSKLRHPNIVQYYGSGYVQKQLCILTAYAEHGTLEKVLQDPEIDVDWAFRIKLATQIAQAMQHLHSKNIAHMDLKSGNVLVTSLSTAAATPSVAIFDFDIAIDFNEDDPIVQPGTLRWAAPEVLEQNKASLKSDIWSYGMVLYELFSRKRPYDTESDAKAEARILAGDLPDLTDCPKPFASLIQSCLLGNVDLRPTFESILNRLKTMVIEEPTPAKISAKKLSLNSLPIAREKIDLVSASENYSSNYGDNSLPQKLKRLLKLLIEFPDGGKKAMDVSVASKKELIQYIKDKFSDLLGFDEVDGEESSPPEISLEFLSPEHNTFVDLDDLDQLKGDKATIRVKVIQASSSHYSNVTKTSTPKGTNLSNALSKFKKLKEVKRQEVIGQGNFGSVYKGMMSITPIVMKKLTSTNPSAYQELIAEATVLSQISHPFVVQFLGICELNGELYMCTEYVPNGSLEKFLDRKRYELTNATLLEMAKSGAAGLDYLSKENIVHRDLAARNLLVGELGHSYILKIADFGLSRTLEDEQSEYVSRSNLMPLRWTALESLRTGIFTTASDVWSFAVVLWEMFEFGKKPYVDELERGKSVIEYLECGGRLGQPSRCPSAVYAMMKRCWEEDPAKRPTFQQIHEVLEAALIIERQQEKAAKEKLVAVAPPSAVAQVVEQVEEEELDGEDYGDPSAPVNSYRPSPAISSSVPTQEV